MASLLYRLGSAAARRPLAFVLAWVLVLGTVVGAMLSLQRPLTNEFELPDSEFAQVLDDLGEQIPEVAGGTGTVVLHSEDGFTAAQREAIDATLADWRATSRTSPARSTPSPPRPSSTAATPTSRRSPAAHRRTRGVREGRPPARSSCAGSSARASATSPGCSAPTPTTPPCRPASTGRPSWRPPWPTARRGWPTPASSSTDGEQQYTDGATLRGLGDGVRLVSEDGTTALVQVRFDASMQEISPGRPGAGARDGRAARRRRRRGRLRPGAGLLHRGRWHRRGHRHRRRHDRAAGDARVPGDGRDAARRGLHRRRGQPARRAGPDPLARPPADGPRAGRHARPRGRHRLRPVHRQPAPAPARGPRPRGHGHRPGGHPAQHRPGDRHGRHRGRGRGRHRGDRPRRRCSSRASRSWCRWASSAAATVLVDRARRAHPDPGAARAGRSPRDPAARSDAAGHAPHGRLAARSGSDAVTRRARAAVVAVVLLMGVLAIPALSLRLGLPDGGVRAARLDGLPGLRAGGRRLRRRRQRADRGRRRRGAAGRPRRRRGHPGPDRLRARRGRRASATCSRSGSARTAAPSRSRSSPSDGPSAETTVASSTSCAAR